MATPLEKVSASVRGEQGPMAASGARPIVNEESLPEPLKLHYGLRDFENFPIAGLIKQADRGRYERCIKAQALGRTWAEEHVLPHAEAWDQRAGDDHTFVPWDAVNAGVKAGFLSAMAPPALGGLGYGSSETAVLMEEWAAADAGLAVVFGAHALALAGVLASQEPGMLVRILTEIVQAEERDEACILALAYTEVGGGSDVEDSDDIKQARITSRFERVPGGYKVNARKVFISNGSIAKYQILIAYEDPKRPLETAAGFVIPQDAPGLSVGRLEHKLGQRLCPAAEIVAEDVFVPDADAFVAPDVGRMIDTVLTVTRGPVGAMGAGISRGCLERTLRYLSQKRVNGHWLFEEQWVQLALADMVAEIQAARGLYFDACLAFDHFGLGQQLNRAMAAKMPLPRFVRDTGFVEKLAGSRGVVKAMRKQYSDICSDASLRRVVAHSSTAKYRNGDGAVAVCMAAMEILGEDANDPQWGVEKCLRDAKLTQIFEGTNQINRLHVARGFFQRS